MVCQPGEVLLCGAVRVDGTAHLDCGAAGAVVVVVVIVMVIVIVIRILVIIVLVIIGRVGDTLFVAPVQLGRRSLSLRRLVE